ncbi:hypothetical protein RF55_19794 [Lasius niger]|uniref:Uncharacterized protein n=1 Tax=Lasius niger TaxID=67767 RepID=A0A0J7MSL1_LASNI|nr:hypothetical protein RF55_19794 [Lasius niger]
METMSDCSTAASQRDSKRKSDLLSPTQAESSGEELFRKPSSLSRRQRKRNAILDSDKEENLGTITSRANETEDASDMMSCSAGDGVVVKEEAKTNRRSGRIRKGQLILQS